MNAVNEEIQHQTLEQLEILTAKVNKLAEAQMFHNKMWTFEDLAQYLGFHVNTVKKNYRRPWNIPHIKISGKCVRFIPSEVHKYFGSISNPDTRILSNRRRKRK